ncbi:GatB/YqeY domain-containing protein [Candidatus Amarolinea aalborgensis]|uniref:GatB/YqeY domain-containing protein n=1 Tax=Candidatus Amarolinea aalborgensis TaxID=2249329 RepID=UPI003BFA0694
MSLKEQLNQELHEAMKARDARRRDTLRQVLTGINYLEVEVGHPLNDAEVLDVIRRDAKRHRESIEEFHKGGRQDLVEQERAELAILETYLPQQMGRAEIEALVREAISELGVSGKAQAGLVMKHLMAQVKGRADGKLVNQVVQELLTN